MCYTNLLSLIQPEQTVQQSLPHSNSHVSRGDIWDILSTGETLSLTNQNRTSHYITSVFIAVFKGQLRLQIYSWFLQISIPCKETNQLGREAQCDPGVIWMTSALLTAWISFPRCHVLGQEVFPMQFSSSEERRTGTVGGPQWWRSGAQA